MIRSAAMLSMSLCAWVQLGPSVNASLARSAPDDSALIASARDQPDSARAQLYRTFSAIASTRLPTDRQSKLDFAKRLAGAYARAWSDSFLVRQVARFETLTTAQRNARVAADSLRLAGNAAMSRDGIPAAMSLWRASLRRALTLGDPVAIAPAKLALGAGFYRLEQLDSASAYLADARNLATRTGDFRTMGNVLGVLASVAKDRGDLPGAAELYRRASAIRARSGDRRGLAADQNNLGLIAQERGDLQAAKIAFRKALALNTRDGRRSLVALNLGNLAGIASVTGDYAAADSLYRQALANDRAVGDRAETGFVLHDLGRLQMRRGDYDQALRSLIEALRIHEQSGDVTGAIGVRIDLGALQNSMGNPESALATLRQGELQSNSSNASAELRAGLAIARADVAIQFGTFAEADSEYARAERYFALARNESGRGDAQQGRAMLLHLRNDDRASMRLLEQAFRTQINAGDRRSAALTQLLLADVQNVSGNSIEARRTLTRAVTSLHMLHDAVGEAAGLSALGDMTGRAGSNREAEVFYRRGVSVLGNRRATEVSWRLRAGLARALRDRGALEAAAREYRLAVSVVEQTAATLHLAERRSGYLADKWDVYTELAQMEMSRGRVADGFAVSERMRARQMIDMLSRGRVAAPRVAAVQEQDLRRRIDELSRQLEGGSSTLPQLREPMVPVRSSDAVRAQLDAAQKAYAQLLAKLREADPEYLRLVSGVTMSARTVMQHLKPDEILLEYLLGDSTSTLFVLTSDTVAAIDLRISRQSLADLIEFAGRTVEKPGSAGAALWRAPLRRLYRQLIEPVERQGFTRGKRTLVIVPHGELHFLSFAALMQPGTTDHFLVEKLQLAYTPSATAWVQLGERGLRASGRDVLAFAPHVDRLPASRQEVQAIGHIYGSRAKVRIGAAASEQALRAGIPYAATLHLATFGVLNKHNPLFSFVELAPSRDSDGRLEVNEVFGLGLSGQLVILSACQTALASGAIADVPPGDDWVGLVQAFLQSGAGSVLASLWPVDDRATELLMERFHRRLASGQSAVVSLADAQRSLLRNPQTSRPFYWAGFVLNGSSSTP